MNKDNKQNNSLSSINKAQQDLIAEFALLPDWLERYQYIVELGRQLPKFPDKWRTDEHKVHGCQSQVWLHCDYIDDKLHFDVLSDAALVNGLLAILLTIYNDRTASEILTTPPDFITELGLDKHLSMNRSNGLYAMLKKIMFYAQKYTTDKIINN